MKFYIDSIRKDTDKLHLRIVTETGETCEFDIERGKVESPNFDFKKEVKNALKVRNKMEIIADELATSVRVRDLFEIPDE